MITLCTDSSYSDILKYLASFTSPEPYSLDKIKELLQNLINLGIDTYNFSYGANRAARTVNKYAIGQLEQMLNEFDLSEEKNENKYDIAFCAYYIVTYYYRVYDKIESLFRTISLYENNFLNHPKKYALTYQIKGRYYRKNGDYKKALDCDKNAIFMLAQNGMENIGVSVTYASTVSIVLEDRKKYITADDIKNSINNVETAIQLRPKHARYYYLLAKLKMFAVLYDGYYSENINIEDVIRDVKVLFQKAIELEDETSMSYAANIGEYKSYLREADLILAEAKLLEKIESQKVSTQEMIYEKFEDSRKEIDIKLKNAQDKYLEILALFVSIISIILVVIGTFSKAFTTVQIISIIISMNASVLAVYSTFLMILRNIEKKYVTALIFSGSIDVILLVFSYFYL